MSTSHKSLFSSTQKQPLELPYLLVYPWFIYAATEGGL